MIELIRHIEYLLLENDCVVVPELGGFITHYQSAHYEETEGIYLPPTRTIGFNPQLTMNDGLLTQSYMQAYHTDFPDATRKIQLAVDKLKETLYSEGRIDMHGIGTLHYNIRGLYEFHPDENGILSPSLYALDAFAISTLAERVHTEEIPADIPVLSETKTTLKEFHLNPHWLGNAVAVAVAAVLFFILSIPVENTYVDKGNYASLGTECLFDAIRTQSMATTLTSASGKSPQMQKTIKPIVVKEEKVAPVAKVEETAKETVPAAKVMKKETVKAQPTTPKTVLPRKKYHIIVASLATSADAQKMLHDFQQKGYDNVSVVEGGGRFRISLYQYTNKNEANQKLGELKQEEAYKAAWIFTSK